jgi:IS5 family transposase
MYVVILWFELLSLMAPHAPAGKTGRPPFATKVMLRIHFLQQFFGPCDPVSKTKMQFLKRLDRDILWR